jgi:transposase
LNPACPKCKERSVKNGSVEGTQRWKCKGCGFQFTRMEPQGKPLWMKLEAALLYMSGMSLNAIGTILDVSAQSILNWVRDFALANYEKPEPEGQVIVVAELDEMWHFIQSKKTKYGSGKHMIVVVGDSSTGKMEIAMLKPSKSSLNA